MKLKNIIASVLLTLGVGVAGISAAQIIKTKEVIVADAANADNSKEKWSAIGTISGSSWNKDFPLAYDATDDRYELEMALTAGNEFKIRLNNAWTTSIGYGGNTGSGISTYLTNSGGNFKVKTTGNYVLWVKDDNVRNYGDKSYGFGIDKAATVEYCTVKHYDKDGKEVKSEDVIKGSVYNPHFIHEEGFRLEGWYTDKNLTIKFEKGAKISSNLNLYPKYENAEDYTILVSDVNKKLKSTLNIYLWRDSFDGGNNTWPGKPLTLTSVDELYSIKIDASQSYDKLIINDGSGQTADVKLLFTPAKYIVNNETDSETKFTVTSSEINAKFLNDFLTEKNEENQCLTRYEETKIICLALTNSELENFKTNNLYAAAKERYEAWARHLGDLTPYEPSTTANLLGAFNKIYKNNNSIILVIICIPTLILAAAIAIKLMKKQK